MTKQQVVEQMGKTKFVEGIVTDILHTSLSSELKDLCQMVYVAVLLLPEDKVADLWESGQMRYYVVRVIINQVMSKTSPYYRQLRDFGNRSSELDAVRNKADGE